MVESPGSCHHIMYHTPIMRPLFDKALSSVGTEAPKTVNKETSYKNL